MPNEVLLQASGSAPSVFSNQRVVPQNQPTAPNGLVYQVPPGYMVVNGQLVAALVTKIRRELAIGIVANSLIPVLATTPFTLLLTGVRSVSSGLETPSEVEENVTTGLAQFEEEPELIDMGNSPGKFYAFIRDTLLAMDGDKVQAFSPKSQKEVWRSGTVIKALNCDSEYDALFVHQPESNCNLALTNYVSETTTHYIMAPTKDGRVVTREELNSDEVSSFMEIPKDGSPVTCGNNELTHCEITASTKKKL